MNFEPLASRGANSGIDLAARLRGVAQAGVARLEADPVAGRLLAGTVTVAEYGAYLTQVFHQIADGAGPMLACAGQRLLARGGSPQLAALLSAKSGEEDSHHLWVLEDAKALGLSYADVTGTPMCSAVRAYRAYTQFLAQHEPLSIFGVAYVLEYFGHALAGPTAQNLLRHSRIPGVQGAVSFLADHGSEDVAHLAELDAHLSAVRALHEQTQVLLAAEVTAQLYVGLFRSDAA